MKVFNTVTNIILIIAVGYLFLNDQSGESKKGAPDNKDLKENLAKQDISGVRMAYINTDSLVAKYEYHKELRLKVEAKAKNLEADMATRVRILQEGAQDLQARAAQLSQEQVQAHARELQMKERELELYQQQRTQELINEEAELTLLIKNDMDSILNNIKSEYDLDYVLSYDSKGVLLSANEDYDMTEILVKRLNEKYEAKKAKKDASQKE